jgi:hypothetical protein
MARRARFNDARCMARMYTSACLSSRSPRLAEAVSSASERPSQVVSTRISGCAILFIGAAVDVSDSGYAARRDFSSLRAVAI